MHQPPISLPLTVKGQVIDRDFVCRQILEVVDMAREQHNVVIALEGMSMIAAIQGMLDDDSCD